MFYEFCRNFSNPSFNKWLLFPCGDPHGVPLLHDPSKFFRSIWLLEINFAYLKFICHLLVTSNFRNNALSTLPSEMGALSRLGTLDLQSNQVPRFSFQLCSINTVNLSRRAINILIYVGQNYAGPY